MTEPKLVRRWLIRFRSAITGRFITCQEAEEHPETTVQERRPQR